MRRHTPIILSILLISSSLFCQDIIMSNNMKNIVKEDFNEEKSAFPILTSKDNYFIIMDGDYFISRNNTETEYAILASTNGMVGDFQLKSSIKLGPSPNKRSSAGMLLKAQTNGSGAIVFEINRKSEFRIKELLDNQTYKYLSGRSNNEGWVKNKNIKGEDEYNSIEIKCFENVFDIYINNSFLTKFFSPNMKDGKMGIIISKDAKARISYYYLDIPSEAKNNLIEEQKENNTLISLTNKIKELESENESLENSNKRLKNDLQTAKNNSIKIDQLEKSNQTKDSLSNLVNEFRDTIYLTLDNFKKERESLISKIESLNSEIRSSEKIQNSFTSKINKLEKKISELKEMISTERLKNSNETNQLKQTVLEKSSQISELKDNLSSTKKDLNSLQKKYPNINTLENRLEKLKNDLSKKEETISSLTLSIQDLKEQIEILTLENKDLKEKNNSLNLDLELSTSTVNELSLKVEHMQEVLIYKGFEEKGINSEEVNTINTENKNNEHKENKNEIYSVQIATYGSKVNIAKFKGLLDVFYYDSGEGTYLYMSGKFRESNNAINHRNKLIIMGYKNAFIVKLNNK